MSTDLHIAEVTDKSTAFEAEIFVSKGFGYVSIENRDDMVEKEVGYIHVDSIFTPINAVRVNIEDVRVGQMTDWEKLVIDIKTDGTVDYQNAFKQAVDILVEQFGFLQENTVKVEDKKVKKEKVVEEADEVEEEVEETKEEIKEESKEEKK